MKTLTTVHERQHVITPVVELIRFIDAWGDFKTFFYGTGSSGIDRRLLDEHGNMVEALKPGWYVLSYGTIDNPYEINRVSYICPPSPKLMDAVKEAVKQGFELCMMDYHLNVTCTTDSIDFDDYTI